MEKYFCVSIETHLRGGSKIRTFQNYTLGTQSFCQCRGTPTKIVTGSKEIMRRDMKTGLKWGKFSAHFLHQHRSGLSWAPGSGLWSSLGHSKWGILVSELYQSSGARGTSACIEDVLLSLTKRVAGSQPQNVSVLCWEHVSNQFSVAAREGIDTSVFPKKLIIH